MKEQISVFILLVMTYVLMATGATEMKSVIKLKAVFKEHLQTATTE